MSDAAPHALDRPVENNEFVGARTLLPRHDFARFHREVLPGLLGERAALATDDVRGLAPIAFAAPDGTAFHYRAGARGIAVADGAGDADTVVEIDGPDFSDYVNEVHTASGLAAGGKIRFLRGGLEQLHRWEPALRALFSGRPIWTQAAAADLVDAAGAPIDLGRTFTLDASDAELRAFLEVAGFLHVRGAFAPDEIAALADEIERVRTALEPGAGDVWWSVTGSGTQVPTRINYLDRWSERIRSTCWDPRVQRLGRLVGEELRVCDDRLDGPMAFIKHSDVAQGLGDLQWHQDDGLGGHPIMCPLMQVGIQLDAASPENGQVWLLAGSHRYSKHPLRWGEEGEQPVVRLETQPGDVTVHYGDVFHTTPPPTAPDAGRRVLYYKFAPPQTFQVIPPGAHYNDVLFKAGAGGRVATRADTWTDDDTQEELESARFGEHD